MAKTRQNIRDYLRGELKIDVNGRVWSDSVLNRNIEVARARIQQDGDFGWSFNDGESTIPTVASTGEYSLPTDFARLEVVQYEGKNLAQATKQALIQNMGSVAVDGIPSYYYLFGDKIGFYARPSETAKTITIMYRKKLAEFSTDASTETMPDEFIEAIVQYAAYLAWSDVQGREDKAIQAMQNYKEQIDGLNTQFLGRRDSADFCWKFETI